MSGEYKKGDPDKNGEWVWVELTAEEAAERKARAEEAKRKAAEAYAKEEAERQRKAIPEAIERLRKEAAEKLAEADKIKKLLAAFPDLRRQVNRWEKVSYSSASVNPKVTDYESRHNCGCCSDSPLEIFPYLDTEWGRVYSNPACFTVGEQDPYGGGDKPYPGWDEKMRQAGIPQPIIERVSYLLGSTENEVQSEEGEDN